MIAVISKRTFHQNRGRNLVAVLAIILTTLMFTTLFVLSQSMNENIVEMTFRQVGYDAQVSFYLRQADCLRRRMRLHWIRWYLTDWALLMNWGRR